MILCFMYVKIYQFTCVDKVVEKLNCLEEDNTLMTMREKQWMCGTWVTHINLMTLSKWFKLK